MKKELKFSCTDITHQRVIELSQEAFITSSEWLNIIIEDVISKQVEVQINRTVSVKFPEVFDEGVEEMRQLLKTKIVDLDLSVRALICFKNADVNTLADLVSLPKHDLLKYRNFGKKSLRDIEDYLANKGLYFGMNLSKYKLEQKQ